MQRSLVILMKVILVEGWGHHPRGVRFEEADGNEHRKIFETFWYKAEQNKQLEEKVEWCENFF